MSEHCKIIFFDIDGTLLSTGGAGQVALGEALHDSFEVEFPFQGVQTSGRTDRGIVDEIFETHGVENTPDSREKFRESYLRRVPAALEGNSGRVYAGVPELLKLLAADDRIALGVLTGNYEASAWLKLRHYGVAEYFGFGGFGDHHAERNDVATIAVDAAEKSLGYRPAPADMLVIGDTIPDIVCSRHIGACAAAVATGNFTADELRVGSPDLLFEDLSDANDVAQQMRNALGLAETGRT